MSAKTMSSDTKKEKAASWFRKLRDTICAEFETLERDAPENLYGPKPGKFTFEDWSRTNNGGGGTGGMLTGRLFEKCGVHISVVHGEFEGEMRDRVPGAKDDPRFWAAGISLIAHMSNPHVPAVHMNTRHIFTTQDWWGGGADLTPRQAPRHTQRARVPCRYESCM